MKFLLAVVASLAVSIGTAGEPDKQLHEKCLYPTVMVINNSKCPRMSGTGTGVIVKSVKEGKKWHNYVLTVAHNIDKTPEHMCGPEQNIKLEEKYEYVVGLGVYENWSTLKEIKAYEDVEVLVDDDEKDIALIKFTSDKQLPVAKITDPKLYIGNKVLRVGCGMAEPFRLDVGIVTALKESAGRRDERLKGTYRLSAPSLQGDSGGPVFTEEYELFAICEAIGGMRSGPMSSAPVYHVMFAVPVTRFMENKEIAKHLK
jgi:S1-C subfamily serine protease